MAVPIPESDNPDRALVDACVRGDEAAWGRFVERFGRLVYAVPRRYGLRADLCEDVFQNVFAIVLKELPRVRDPRTLPKWLITVASRETLRAARKSGRACPGTPVELRHAGLLPELDRLEREQIVRECLAELEDPCRTLLQELFSVESPDYALIAQRLNMPIGSIGPTRGRCLQKLLAIVRRRLGEE